MSSDVITNIDIENKDLEEYLELYKQLIFFTDNELIDKWKFYQHLNVVKPEISKIGIIVCEDILRLRGNNYIDITYPKDF